MPRRTLNMRRTLVATLVELERENPRHQLDERHACQQPIDHVERRQRGFYVRPERTREMPILDLSHVEEPTREGDVGQAQDVRLLPLGSETGSEVPVRP